MEGNFTEESRSLLISAKEEMYKLKHSYVGTEHLLLAILKSNLKNRLNKYNITYEIALKNIKKIVGVGTKETDLFLYTPVLKRIIENSIIDSKDNNTDVTQEILFLNFLEEGEGVGIRILLISNIDLDKLYLEFKDKYIEIRPSGTDAKTKAYGGGTSLEEISEYSKVLGNYSGERTELHKKLISEEFYNNSKEMALNDYLKFVDKDANNEKFEIPEYNF